MGHKAERSAICISATASICKRRQMLELSYGTGIYSFVMLTLFIGFMAAHQQGLLGQVRQSLRSSRLPCRDLEAPSHSCC